MTAAKRPINPKLILRDKKSILTYAKKTKAESIQDNRSRKFKTNGGIKDYDWMDKKDHEIHKMRFKNIIFSGDIHYIEFIGCSFIDCEFNGVWGFFLIFTKCKFQKCSFRYSRFSHIEWCWDQVEFTGCQFRTVEWDEAGLTNIIFNKCYLVNFKISDVNPIDNVVFLACHLEGSTIEHIGNHPDELKEDIESEFYHFHFDECNIENSLFNATELRNSLFYNCSLYKLIFMECRLASGTIKIDRDLKGPFYASLDNQSILKSEPIDPDILSTYFNINKHINMQELISSLTEPIEFYTLFISYSLKDKVFANRLNTALQSKGIRTFLWEKDAPAGKTLQEIMTAGVQKHNKVLFIASENSIKSKACQFELSEARAKQETTWKTVFFPIHIDSFLFSVQKAAIRPIDMANEYWGNIEELKKVNSIDFSAFNKKEVNMDAFDIAVNNLIKDLKIENPEKAV